MYNSLSLQTAWLIRYQGKEIFSLQDSKAFIALLGAILLELEDLGAVRVEPEDAVQRAQLLPREVEVPAFLTPFLHSIEDDTVLDFMECWTAIDSPARGEAKNAFMELLAEPARQKEMEEAVEALRAGERVDPRLVSLLKEADLIGAILPPPVLSEQEEERFTWGEQHPDQMQLIEALPLLWIMRFVQ